MLVNLGLEITQVALLYGDLVHSTVLKDNGQVPVVSSAGGVRAQNQEVVGGDSGGGSLKQDHTSQLAGLIGAIISLGQDGIDLSLSVGLNIAHIIPAHSNTVLILICIIIETDGV